MRKRYRLPALIVCLMAQAVGLEAREALRLGSEFQVNSYTAGFQLAQKIASDADGDFVMIWSSSLQDGSQAGVFAQRFDSAGSKQGVEFQVNSRTEDSQHASDVVLSHDGDFVVSWDANDGGLSGVFAKRFDSAGTAVAGEFQVNVRTEGGQARAVVGVDSDGDFIVAWGGGDAQDGSVSGVFGRRFEADGAPIGGELPGASTRSGNPKRPSSWSRRRRPTSRMRRSPWTEPADSWSPGTAPKTAVTMVSLRACSTRPAARVAQGFR